MYFNKDVKTAEVSVLDFGSTRTYLLTILFWNGCTIKVEYVHNGNTDTSMSFKKDDSCHDHNTHLIKFEYTDPTGQIPRWIDINLSVFEDRPDDYEGECVDSQPAFCSGVYRYDLDPPIWVYTAEETISAFDQAARSCFASYEVSTYQVPLKISQTSIFKGFIII